MGVRQKAIRARVNEILAKNGISAAPVDVEAIAKALGAEIRRKPTEKAISGFMLRDRERTIIGVNENHSRTRQRFTIAHEIGHLLLHESEKLHIDEYAPGYSLFRRDPKSSDGTDVIEREANFFAAELLMPQSFLEKDTAGHSVVDLLDPDERVLRDLAKKYRVSVQALTFRLANLGFIHG